MYTMYTRIGYNVVYVDILYRLCMSVSQIGLGQIQIGCGPHIHRIVQNRSESSRIGLEMKKVAIG